MATSLWCRNGTWLPRRSITSIDLTEMLQWKRYGYSGRAHAHDALIRSTNRIIVYERFSQSTSFNDNRNMRHRLKPTASKREIHSVQKEIARKILAAENSYELLNIISTVEEGSLTDQHLTMALLRIARNSDDLTPEQRSTLLRQIIDQLENKSVTNWNMVQISNILESCYRLKLAASRLLEFASVSLDRYCGHNHSNSISDKDTASFTTFDLTSLINILARYYSKTTLGDKFLQIVSDKLLEHVEDSCPQEKEKNNSKGKYTIHDLKLSIFTDKQLGMLAWAFTAKNINNSEEIADTIFNEGHMRGFYNLPSQTIAHIFRLSAEKGSLQMSTKQLNCLLQETRKSKKEASDMNSRDIGMLFSSYAKLYKKAGQFKQLRDMNLDRIPEGFLAQAPNQIEDLKAIALPAYDFESRQFLQGAKKLAFKMKNHVFRMGCKEICSMCYSLALLQIAPMELMSIVEKRIFSIIDLMDARSLSTILWSMAALRYDSPILVTALLQKLMQLIDDKYDENFDCIQTLDIQMALFSMAVLDLCGSWTEKKSNSDIAIARKLFSLLIQISTQRIVEGVDPCVLSQLGWAVVVCKGSHRNTGVKSTSFQDFFIAWRSAMLDGRRKLKDHDLATVHIIEVALKMDSSLGPLDAFDSTFKYESLLGQMYESGRIRNTASRKWEIQLNIVREALQTHRESSDEKKRLQKVHTNKCISQLQLQIFDCIKDLLSEYGDDELVVEMEFKDPVTGYLIDIALPNNRIAIEADGPTHFTRNTLRPLGPTLMKWHLLEIAQWAVVSVPFGDWNASQDKRSYLKHLIGLPLLKSSDDYPDAMKKYNNLSNAGEICNESHTEKDFDLSSMKKRAQNLDIMRYKQGKISRQDFTKRDLLRNPRNLPK